MKKCNSRLFYLCHLKRAGLSSEDLLMYYQSVIRSILEYACQVWHFGLTQELSNQIEHIQKRAVKIICPELEYDDACDKLKLEHLCDRRLKLCHKLFNQIRNDTNHKLYYLLPPIHSNNYNLRKSNKLPKPRVRTKRTMGSFINSSLFIYNRLLIFI